PGVWRRLGVPAVLAVAAVLVGALLAWAAGFVVLPAALTLVAVVVVLLVALAGLVLWPASASRDR
uniref:hypothetical protein n=1 Tax=Desertihabitans aurantiacus TaxID=2282477 RepID=UPI00130087E8